MNKVIEFPDIEDLQIQMERTEDFYKAARALSDYLSRSRSANRKMMYL